MFWKETLFDNVDLFPGAKSRICETRGAPTPVGELLDRHVSFSVKMEKMKRQTTIYIEDSILQALKIAAARSQKHDYEVIEQALRTYLGMELLQRTGSSLGEKKAMTVAYRELHRSRKK